ncbi:MAG TPA: diacylglycerol kinase family protein [Longimicrobiales bacterium]|nr:diacylglycerol kinase family protein [Longimicrobiales bacterium]
MSAYANRSLIIINPKAGSEDAVTLMRKLGGAFAARGANFDIIQTEKPGHATDLARHAATLGYRTVCVVGGDGTIAEAATGLVGTQTPLAVIPRGTANQVALNLAIPIRFEAAVETAVNGRPMPIDLGKVDGRAFALIAGAGFDAAMMSAATRDLKERWGFGAYVYGAVKSALNMSPAKFCVRADDRVLEISAVSVMIANVGALFTKYIPVRFPLTPHALGSWTDGVFDIVIVAPKKFPDWASVLWSAALRDFSGNERLIHLQARTVTIESDQPIPTQIDGDPVGTTPLTATVIEKGVQIMVPA